MQIIRGGTGIKTIRACEAGKNICPQISEVFVDGFYQWLKFFSKDKEKLTRAFTHMFNLNVFYVTIDGDKVAGITACTDGVAKCVRLQKQPLRKHLGFVMGTITHSILKKQFEEKPYPFEITEGTGTIEFVATSPEYRGKGVAAAMIRHIMDAEPYAEYVLEVADTNEAAVRLYERLGFVAFLRIPAPKSKVSCVNNFVYMKMGKETPQCAKF